MDLNDNVDYHNFTFGQLKHLIKPKRYKHLHIVTTQISPLVDLVDFNSEDSKFDDVIIADAVRASMSIPLLFKPHDKYIKYENKRVHIPGQTYVDGGIIKNFPLRIFDRLKFKPVQFEPNQAEFPEFNATTLGVSIVDATESVIPEISVNVSALDIAKKLTNVYWSSECLSMKFDGDIQTRVINVVNVPSVTAISFNITASQQQLLIDSGSQAVRNFFKGAPLPERNVVGLSTRTEDISLG